MFLKCSCIMDTSIRIMKIVVIERICFWEGVFPHSKWNIGDWGWRISLAIPRIEWMLNIDNFVYKCRCTLLLCFGITSTYRCVRSHRNSFFYSFCENPCDNWLFSSNSFFSYNNRCQDEFLISTRREFTIRRSNNLVKLTKENACDIFGGCVSSNPIRIRIEKSFKTSFSLQKIKLFFIDA